MRDTKMIRTVPVEEINERVYLDPRDFVYECEKEYSDQLEQTVTDILESGKRVVFLAGPSASGKTTTANFLANRLERRGIHATVVSMDNFYLGRGNVPLLEDGTEDYESVYALDVGRINACMDQLYEYGCTNFPIFDFAIDSPSDETQTIRIGTESILIVEGIHALNPLFSQNQFGQSMAKLDVSVNTQFTYRDRIVYSPRTIRYVRRLVRDYHFRGQPLERTTEMWGNVCKGEELYIRPFKDQADWWIDSTLNYEGCVFHHFLYTILNENKYRIGPELRELNELYEIFDYFDDIDKEEIPAESLLHEFIK